MVDKDVIITQLLRQNHQGEVAKRCSQGRVVFSAGDGIGRIPQGSRPYELLNFTIFFQGYCLPADDGIYLIPAL